MFDTLSRNWSQLDVSTNAGKPVGVVGHTATVVGNEMIVLFGYNPGQGYVNKTRVLDLGKYIVGGFFICKSVNFFTTRENAINFRLRVVPHFSSGIVERVKRERA